MGEKLLGKTRIPRKMALMGLVGYSIGKACIRDRGVFYVSLSAIKEENGTIACILVFGDCGADRQLHFHVSCVHATNDCDSTQTSRK